jgi:hypothetical protein
VRRRAAALGCVFVLVAAAARAQDQLPPEQVEPDRPDITNGTHIVDVGVLQIEIGGLFTRPTAGQRQSGTPVAARLGVSEWLELRVGTDGLLTQTSGLTSATGMGNVQLGAKLRLWADEGGVPVVSILPAVNLPVASAEKSLGSGVADLTVAFLTGADLGRHGHVDVNYGIGAIGAAPDQPRFAQHLLSLSASAAASDNWNPYVETFWFSREEPDGRGVLAMDAGAIYEIGERYAVDGGVQLGLTADAPAFAVFAGISIIVGDVLGSHGVHARQRQRQRRARGRPRG